MLVQAAALPPRSSLPAWPLVAGLASAVLLGVGTAMVYPTLIAAVSDATHPSLARPGLGVYRFWRDLGFALGALIAGLLAQALGLSAAVIAGGVAHAGIRAARGPLDHRYRPLPSRAPAVGQHPSQPLTAHEGLRLPRRGPRPRTPGPGLSSGSAAQGGPSRGQVRHP